MEAYHTQKIAVSKFHTQYISFVTRKNITKHKHTDISILDEEPYSLYNSSCISSNNITNDVKFNTSALPIHNKDGS